MATKPETTRILIEIPKTKHKRLKAKAALLGKSMKALILEALEAADDACEKSDHIPNAETKKAISDAKKGKGLTEYKNLGELFKKMGI